MRLIGITNRGLAVISVLVMVLWGLILAERSILRQARQDHYEFQRSHPIAAPHERPLPVEYNYPPTFSAAPTTIS